MRIFHHQFICKVAGLGAGLGLMAMLSSCSSQPPFELALVGNWQVEDISGGGVIDNSPASVEFHEDGTVSGNSSCNNFSGTYSTNSGRQRIIISDLATTRRACVEALMNQEQSFLEVMSKVNNWQISEPEGQLTLIDAASEMWIRAARQ